MAEEIHYKPAYELAELIRSRALSPVEVVQAHLDRIEELNPRLNAVVIFPQEDPLALAREAEAAVMRGDELGPLHGVPFTLKDCIETAGLRMTLGSKLLADNVSEQDALVYTRLRGAGGILLGKTNMPEFALWWETGNLVFGLTRNPWNLEHTAGGSSGGEASAMASGMSPLGLGTDLGGSIREPSAFCGLVGLKPTIGRVPYTGIQPQVIFRAIHVGPMARTARDVALAMSVLAGPDGVDPYAIDVPVQDYMNLDGPVSGLRVGFSPTAGIAVEPAGAGCDKRGRRSLGRVGDAGGAGGDTWAEGEGLWGDFCCYVQRRGSVLRRADHRRARGRTDGNLPPEILGDSAAASA